MDQHGKPVPERVRISGERPLRPAKIDEEWHAMVTSGPTAIAELPGETSFRARLEHSGLMRDGWPDPANVAMRTVFDRIGWSYAGIVTEYGRDRALYRITRPRWQARRP